MDPGLRERLLTALDAAGVAAEVVITQNRATMLSVRAKRSMRGTRALDREVRIAAAFAELGDDIIDPIVAFALDLPGAGARVHELISRLPAARSIAAPSAIAHRLRSRREPPIRSRGLHHDLAELAEEERQAHFPELDPIPIAWGRREARRRTPLRSLRLGSYEPTGPIVRIHPRLDDPRVPGWFVGFVIFHELLHHALGIRMSPRGDRRELHPPAFREAEAAHPRYAQALAWEARHISALLSPDW